MISEHMIYIKNFMIILSIVVIIAGISLLTTNLSPSRDIIGMLYLSSVFGTMISLLGYKFLLNDTDSVMNLSIYICVFLIIPLIVGSVLISQYDPKNNKSDINNFRFGIFSLTLSIITSSILSYETHS
jgi:hypothetical protein